MARIDSDNPHSLLGRPYVDKLEVPEVNDIGLVLLSTLDDSINEVRVDSDKPHSLLGRSYVDHMHEVPEANDVGLVLLSTLDGSINVATIDSDQPQLLSDFPCKISRIGYFVLFLTCVLLFCSLAYIALMILFEVMCILGLIYIWLYPNEFLWLRITISRTKKWPSKKSDGLQKGDLEADEGNT